MVPGLVTRGGTWSGPGGCPLSGLSGHSRHPPDQVPRDQVHPPEYGQRAAGTHPTGMHSCLKKTHKISKFPFLEMYDLQSDFEWMESHFVLPEKKLQGKHLVDFPFTFTSQKKYS